MEVLEGQIPNVSLGGFVGKKKGDSSLRVPEHVPTSSNLYQLGGTDASYTYQRRLQCGRQEQRDGGVSCREMETSK